MPLKPIRRINIRRQILRPQNKVPENKSKLDSFIESFPDFDKKELRIIKINGEYYDLSQNRTDISVEMDCKKLVVLLNLFKLTDGKIYNVKDIHTHIGNDPLPSTNDILSAISVYKHLSAAFSFPIFVIDPITKRISGRTVVYLGNKANYNLKNRNNLSNLTLDRVQNNITEEYRNYILENKLLTSGRDKKTGEIVMVPSKNAKTQRMFQYEYLKLLLGYKIKFQPYPGYRLDKNTMSFEKI